MRDINLIIIHCSATREDRRYNVHQCRHDHIHNNGWHDIGYHFYIERDGRIFEGRPIDAVGAHCAGLNFTSIGVCYEGGLDSSGNPADTRTEAQKASLLALLKTLKLRFPNAQICGHNEFSKKSCPCFNARLAYACL